VTVWVNERKDPIYIASGPTQWRTNWMACFKSSGPLPSCYTNLVHSFTLYSFSTTLLLSFSAQLGLVAMKVEGQRKDVGWGEVRAGVVHHVHVSKSSRTPFAFVIPCVWLTQSGKETRDTIHQSKANKQRLMRRVSYALTWRTNQFSKWHVCFLW
jgi:hypothetical protein